MTLFGGSCEDTNVSESMIIEIIKIVISGLFVGLASSVTVGPVAVLCIQRTLSRGYFSGLFSGLGVATADTLMAILAFSLYALLKDYIDQYNTIIMLAGGAFVIVVGIFIFFKNPVPQVRKNRAGKTALWHDFGSMFGFTLANFAIIIPYILAFFTMFNVELSNPLPVIVNEKEKTETVVNNTVSLQYDTDYHNIGEKLTQKREKQAEMANEEQKQEAKMHNNIPSMVRNALILAGFLLGAMAWWLSLTSLINLFRRDFRPRHLVVINRIAGIIIATLGIYTLISEIIKL